MEDETMNRGLIKILLGVIFLPILFSCEKDQEIEYLLDGKVYFNERITISSVEQRVTEKNFSFALQNSALMIDTFKIKVKLMGYLSDNDRSFSAQVVPDSSSAVEGVHYKLLDGVIKANEYVSYLPVVLFRTDDTKEESVSVLLQLTDNGELSPGNSEDIQFRLTWGDILLRPENWPEYFFGSYSNNKYRFAIDVLGLTDWPMTGRVTPGREEGVYTIAEIQHFASELNKAYQEYREANGPIYVNDDAPVLEEIYYGSN